MDALQPALTTLQHHAVQLLTFQSYTSLLQAFLLAVIVYTALTRAYLPRRSRDNDNEGTQSDDDAAVAAKIAAWKPAPLARDVGNDGEDEASVANEAAQGGLIDGGRLILKSAAGPTVDVLLEGSGKEVFAAINLSSLNFLGLVGDPAVLEKCKATMEKYGCGACGPRGFYGTVDVHLECEAAVAKMFDVPDAILYSFGSSAQSSVIPAFCKRGDAVICDKGISFALQTGVNLSRADVSWFEHNDMADLERALAEVTAFDVKDKSRATRQRRFIIVEGVYANYGDIAPLDEIVSLKNRYNFRLVLDESASLGCLGHSGRGALEHFKVAREDVEIATADLGNAFASVGGVCVGEPGVVSHQRLSGAGYCFSAAQPPFLATAATEAIAALDSRGAGLVAKARDNVDAFRTALNLPELSRNGWRVDGDARSPLMHVRAARASTHTRLIPQTHIIKIQKLCLDGGVLVAAPRYVAEEAWRPSPSIRLTVSAAHNRGQMRAAGKVISEVLLALPPANVA